jgi:hypothetical protein
VVGALLSRGARSRAHQRAHDQGRSGDEPDLA